MYTIQPVDLKSERASMLAIYDANPMNRLYGQILHTNSALNGSSLANVSPKQANQVARISNTLDDHKPSQSYIGLIAMAILSRPDKKIVLNDIYQYILDNYVYFRNRGPGWRNSIRHNLSLNDCFIKTSRSANGKGHYWTINPANYEDFSRGDFRRRRAQRRARKKNTRLKVTSADECDDDDRDDDYAPSDLSSIQKYNSNSNDLVKKRKVHVDNWPGLDKRYCCLSFFGFSRMTETN
jgi:hypothetical protein